jgi:hypothetical protein
MKYTNLNTTSNFDPQSNPLSMFMLANSETVDSRFFINAHINKVYKSEDIVRPNIYTTSYFVKSFLDSRPSDVENELEETYYYQDRNLVNKILKLVEDIGTVLFRKLNDKQKIMMARTAGSIEFANKIDINSVYKYLNDYEV